MQKNARKNSKIVALYPMGVVSLSYVTLTAKIFRRFNNLTSEILPFENVGSQCSGKELKSCINVI